MSELDEIERLTRIEEKYTNLCTVLNEQTKEIERLWGALHKYGDHDGDCLIGQEPYYICDCGLSKALRADDE